MENFCTVGKLEKKDGYEVCRGVRRQGKLRYDLTKIQPARHTLGHVHEPKLPELFEVVSGQAVFLTQGQGKTYAIEAGENEQVVIMPDFSIRTVNPSPDKELIVSNWIDEEVKNDYNAFTEIPEPIRVRPKKLPAELANLDFLSQPEKYENLLTFENLYQKI